MTLTLELPKELSKDLEKMPNPQAFIVGAIKEALQKKNDLLRLREIAEEHAQRNKAIPDELKEQATLEAVIEVRQRLREQFAHRIVRPPVPR